MRGTPLASSWAKLDRAKEQADTFQAQLAEATDPKKHPVILDRKIEPDPSIEIPGWIVHRVVFFVAEMPTFTTDHALLLGEVLHNFRSSLDHMAWVLVRRKGQRRLSADEQRGIQFPLARTRGSYWYQVGLRKHSRQTLRLPGVPRDPFLTLIEGYQPYHRSPIGRTMWSLRNLSDTDKHRFIVPTYTLLGGASHNTEVVRGNVVGPWAYLFGPDYFPSSGRRRMKPGAHFLEVPVATRDGQPEVRMEGSIGVAPMLRGTGNHASFQVRLIGSACTEILSKVEALL